MAARRATGISFGPVTPRLTRNGLQTGYQIELWHEGLSAHRVLADRDPAILDNKVEAQLARWNEKWERKRDADEKRSRVEKGKAAAEQATLDASAALRACDEILAHTLSIDDRVDWESLKDRQMFERPSGSSDGIEYDASSGKPLRVIPIERPSQPEAHDFEVAPQLSILDYLFSSRRGAKEEEAVEESANRLAQAEGRWARAVVEIDEREASLRAHLESEYQSWKAAEEDHRKRQNAVNAEVDALKDAYYGEGANKLAAIDEHAELVLDASRYEDWMEADFDLGFNLDSRMLTVEYGLPARDRMPTLTKVTFVNGEMREKHLTERQANSLYDSVCYQVAIRTLHELFEADEADAFGAIVFNGWVDAVDPGTGLERRACILSVQAGRDDFLAINLSAVDPRACFKSLKGVAATTLAGMTPVQPILQLDRSDARFVASRDVADALTSGTNLAAMPWEEFEHLIRELFEQEFASSGGEVHVTQASRDGGVDAIAFDPDPIRGGKIVIQAKRYTATVDVAAVRDLYGTVLNEGATKGILVTTADYGPDSYDFAKDKPLTLLNGSNLLALLEKHGHKARIDIREARTILRAEADED